MRYSPVSGRVRRATRDRVYVATIETGDAPLRRVEYGFEGKRHDFSTLAVFLLSLSVGVVGGIYSIGGGP
jgi:uncharacterized protein